MKIELLRKAYNWGTRTAPIDSDKGFEMFLESIDLAQTESLSPVAIEPVTEKEPDVKDGFEKWLENKIAISIFKNEIEVCSNILNNYRNFSPVSQTKEEKLKSIISDKPSNWYEKALERKVKKLEAELSQTKEECVHCDKVFTKEDSKVHSDCAIELAKCQTKGLDITDEEISQAIESSSWMDNEDQNTFEDKYNFLEINKRILISKLSSLLSQSKQETETNK